MTTVRCRLDPAAGPSQMKQACGTQRSNRDHRLLFIGPFRESHANSYTNDFLGKESAVIWLNRSGSCKHPWSLRTGKPHSKELEGRFPPNGNRGRASSREHSMRCPTRAKDVHCLVLFSSLSQAKGTSCPCSLLWPIFLTSLCDRRAAQTVQEVV